MTASSSTSALRCAFLLTPGEILEAAEELHRLGYQAEPYPTTQDVSTLRDTVPPAELDYFLPAWRDHNTPYVRSLRSSFARLLTDPRWQGDDFIIFGESDAAPVTESQALRRALERELAAHPETDLLRLFHHKTVAPGEPPASPAQFLFSPYLTASRTKCSLYVWGTHALVVPAASREKVARLFLNNILPIDNALEMAASRGELNIRVAEHNHFYQQPRTHSADKTVSYAWRRRKIAIGLCVRNLMHLDRLAAWFLAEPYAESHLFIAVKGMTEPVFRNLVEARWHSAIQAGRMTLRLFPEKNPVSDVLDAFRGSDAEHHDLFLMLRESDAPAPGFMETLNAFHSSIPENYSGYYKGTAWELAADGTPVRKDDACGQGTCFSLTRETFLALRELEGAPEPEPCGDGEQDLLFRLVTRYGRKNMAPFLGRELPGHFLIYPCASQPGKCHSLQKARQASRQYFRHEEKLWEHVLELRHPGWCDHFHLLGKEGCRAANGDRASIQEFTDRQLCVKWDKWGVECFVRESDGGFRMKQGAASEAKPSPTPETVPAPVLSPGTHPTAIPAGERNGDKPATLPPLPELSAERRGVCTLARQETTPEELREWITFHLKTGASVVAVYLPEEREENSAETDAGREAHKMKQYLDSLAEKYGADRVWIRPWNGDIPVSQLRESSTLAAQAKERMRREDGTLSACLFSEPEKTGESST